MVNRKMGHSHKYHLEDGFEVVFETPDDGYSYFFGYYDISPLNRSGDKLLVHRAAFDGREVKGGDVAEVGYFDLSDSCFHAIGETCAWNWQVGAHLQWLPPDYDNNIIYNVVRDGKYVAIIHDIRNQEEKIVPFPVYAIHPSGEYALGVNYERLFFCRPGYNYQSIVDEKWNAPHHPEDGIFRVDFKTGEILQVVSTSDIVALKPKASLERADNWLEHLQWSPGGERFLFFHRWRQDGEDLSRLFTANKDGSDLFMYPDCGFYSHYWWINDAELMVWTYEPGKDSTNPAGNSLRRWLSRFRRIISPLYLKLEPLIPSRINDKLIRQSKLLVFKDRSLDYQLVAGGALRGNGHSSLSGDGRLVLNDTYQDEENYRELQLYSLLTGKKTKVGSFFSTHNDTGFRCDLHPRFCFDDKLISIDSGHDFNRKSMLISLPQAMTT